MKPLVLLAACAALLAAGPRPADAAVETRSVVVSLTAGELADVMHAYGYRAELGTDGVGDPMVSSSTAGLNYSVLFYDCDGGTPKRCRSLQLWASFELPSPLEPGKLNTWNRQSRYAKAFTADDGSVVVELDIELDGGVTQANLHSLFALWDTLLGSFARHIDW